jgi:hypothetical protein
VNVSQHSEISTEKYWRFNFKAVMGLKQLTRYIVLNVEPVLTAARPSAKMGKVRVGGKAGSVSRGRGRCYLLFFIAAVELQSVSS